MASLIITHPDNFTKDERDKHFDRFVHTRFHRKSKYYRSYTLQDLWSQRGHWHTKHRTMRDIMKSRYSNY